jgi:hypothetical protein
MAASALTKAKLIRAGLTESLETANADGNFYTNTGNEWLEISNTDSSLHTVYAAVYADGLTFVQGRSWDVTEGTRVKVAPLPPSPYNDGNSKVQLTYDDATGMKVGLFYK